MVREYKKKTNRQSWSTEAMNNAVEAVISGQFGYLEASNQFDVPQSTLERYVKKKRENPDYKIDKTAGKFKNVFTDEQELELVRYLKTLEDGLFGLTMKDLRSLAYQFAVRNGIGHRFHNGIAGQDWVNGFLKRHPTLSVRKLEAASAARAMVFDEVSVDMFFSMLRNLLDEHKLKASQIFNCEETTISLNPENQSKITACKGKRQVWSFTSSEKGEENVTCLICMSANGSYMPPMLIFPRRKKHEEFEFGLPPGGWAEVHNGGWVTAESFLVWFRKFVEFSKASKDFPVLLISDGHSTYLKNLQVIDYAKENGVLLLCLPPHCSHKLQPIDVSFMEPLSLRYGDELQKWLQNNPGKDVTLFEISTLFGSAFIHTATMETAIEGFRATGIWPIDPSIFVDDDFPPADTTDIRLGMPLTKEIIVSGTGKLELSSPSPPINSNDDTPAKKGRFHAANNATPGCSWMVPAPNVEESAERMNQKRGKTTVVTDPPHEEELEAAVKEKKEYKLNYHAKKRYLKRTAVASCNLPDWKNWKEFVEVTDGLGEVPEDVGDLKIKEEPSEDPNPVCKEELIIPDEIDHDPISVPVPVSVPLLSGLAATTQVATTGIFMNNSVPIFVTNPIQFPIGNVLPRVPEVREAGVQVKSGDLLLRFLHFVKSDSELHTATGIRGFPVLERIVDALKSVQPDRPNANLNARDRVVMTYVKLRQNLSYAFLAMLFHCTPQHCKRIIYETVRVLSRHLGKTCESGLRIERSHQKVKAFRLVGEKMPSNLVPLAGDIFAVICATVSLNSSVFGEDEPTEETVLVKDVKSWRYEGQNGDNSENVALKNSGF